jgi:acetyl esterase/lipase
MRPMVCVAIYVAMFSETIVHAAPTSTQPSRPVRALLTYQGANGELHPVLTSKEWRKRRSQILAAMQDVMGPLPDRSNLPAVSAEVLETAEVDGLTRQKLLLQVGEPDRVPAFLLLPKGVSAEKKLPAMLALHQTVLIGKGEPVGLGTNPDLWYGLELAHRGYVVLAPDYPSFGEYSYDFKQGKYVSGTMKGIFNHMRCVDYLCSRAEVDPARIGVIGHSLGGHNSIFVAAFDERIRVTVSSCGWTPFQDYFGGKLKGWTSDRYMPRIRDVYDNDPDRLPFEFDEIVALLAPRAFFSNSPIHDDNFDVSGVRRAIDRIRPVYALFDAGNRLVVKYPDCQHAFPPEVRREAYAFVDRSLR